MVGIGPGGPLDRTPRAEKAILESQVVVGYKRYLDLIGDLIQQQELISSGMTKETDRCLEAVRKAGEGFTVSLISSGDSGVYGMAGLALELADREGQSFPIEIVPGITAAGALAARLGAPLMLDFACIQSERSSRPVGHDSQTTGSGSCRGSGDCSVQSQEQKANGTIGRSCCNIQKIPDRQHPGGNRNLRWNQRREHRHCRSRHIPRF